MCCTSAILFLGNVKNRNWNKYGKDHLRLMLLTLFTYQRSYFEIYILSWRPRVPKSHCHQWKERPVSRKTFVYLNCGVIFTTFAQNLCIFCFKAKCNEIFGTICLFDMRYTNACMPFSDWMPRVWKYDICRSIKSNHDYMSVDWWGIALIHILWYCYFIFIWNVIPLSSFLMLVGGLYHTKTALSLQPKEKSWKINCVMYVWTFCWIPDHDARFQQIITMTLNERDGVYKHPRLDCLLKQFAQA